MLASKAFQSASHIAVVVLLTWAGVDLSNPELCALDREGFPAQTSTQRPSQATLSQPG